MRIAIITAMAEETAPILKSLGSHLVDESNIAGVDVKKFELGADALYLATSGVGEIKAALSVQLLKDLFDVEAVLNVGFVGALNPALSIAELVVVDRVCHYQFDISAIDEIEVGRYSDHEDRYFYLDEALIERALANIGKPVRRVTVASGDKFIAAREEKERLRRGFEADICEMELAGLAIACERNNLPLLSVKVVSDKADESATADFGEIVHRGMEKLAAILPDVLSALEGTTNPRTPARRR
ncbi:MAG: 5'-methylthioadenosine/S-adenosylhomocysteine nucleosidase [Clostridia bacterium]|nr:5'-methylthioadenosine/S-adenosylhomocysteine nucleosidase [Clostridia bacterium]